LFPAGISLRLSVTPTGFSLLSYFSSGKRWDAAFKHATIVFFFSVSYILTFPTSFDVNSFVRHPEKQYVTYKVLEILKQRRGTCGLMKLEA
jgi:hypothetical protein